MNPDEHLGLKQRYLLCRAVRTLIVFDQDFFDPATRNGSA
jgi:hypothetical protein